MFEICFGPFDYRDPIVYIGMYSKNRQNTICERLGIFAGKQLEDISRNAGEA